MMIRKVLGTAAVAALAGFGAATPAHADPGSFSGLGCTCQPTLQQLLPFLQHQFTSTPDDPIDQGIRQGFADTDPGATQH
jgi:hypothetical protein